MVHNSEETFDAMKEDVFREIANIGAGHASTALSMMLECPVEQAVPVVELVRLGDMTDLLGGAERIVVGAGMCLSGDVNGYIIAIMEPEQAKHIIELIRNQPVEAPPEGMVFSPMDESALNETVNIMGGSYLTALSQMTGLELIPSTPFAALDMLGSIMGVVLAEAGQDSDYVLYFKSALISGSAGFMGDLLLIPDKKTYTTFLKSLGCE